MSAESSSPHTADRHPFGVLLTQHRRRSGLTQTHLAELSGYHPAILVRMCQGKKDLTGPSGRERVIRLIEVLRVEGALHTLSEANTLLAAADMPPLYDGLPLEATLIQLLRPSSATQTNTMSGSASSSAPLPTRHLPPIPANNLIGREEEVSTAFQLLRSYRFVSLTGAGGSGKTSLALAIAQSVAAQFAHGVCFVSLAAIQHEELVPSAIAECLNVPNRPNLSITDNIKHYLRDRHLLLILDNFEHVLDAASIVGEILACAARVKILATSREALRLSGEHILTVEPLQPEAACLLFIERAQAAKHTFTITEIQRPTLLQICRRIDCLPLAIELAAARIRHFTPEHLLKMLSQIQSGQRLSVLAEAPRDMPARQRTLHNTIEWSYRLLNQDEQCLLRVLGVFIDGAEIEQLIQVYRAIGPTQENVWSQLTTLLQSLLDKNLIYVEHVAEGIPRYRLLELIREFALAMLTPPDGNALELKVLRDAHANAYADITGDGFEVLHGAAGQKLADQLQLNYSNLHAALEWSFSQGDPQTGCRLVGGLTKFWGSRPRFLHYAERWTRLAKQALSEHMTLKVQANVWKAVSQYSAASPDENVEARKRFLTLYESIGDQDNIALGKCLYGQALFWDRGQRDNGVRLLQESLALAYKVGITGEWLVRLNLQTLGQFAGCMGNLDQAEVYFQESFKQFKMVQDLDGIGESLLFLSEIAIKRRQFEQAIELAQQALPVSRAFESFYMETWARRLIADIYRRLGDSTQAIAHAQATLEFAREHTTEGFCISTLITLARALDTAGEYDQALLVFNEALHRLKQAEGVYPARGLPAFVGLAYELKEAITIWLANPMLLADQGNLAQLRAILP